MISDADKATILELGRRYHARRIWLFGSSARPGAISHDIDLAVEGIASAEFFRFCGELMLALSKPADVVDVGRPTRFASLIREEAVSLYG